MFRSLALILLWAVHGAACAQVVFYSTANDMVDDRGEVLHGYRLKSVTDGKTLLLHLVNDSGDEIKRGCKDVWGFRVDSLLFRTVPGKAVAACIVLMDGPEDIVYYENGVAHLAEHGYNTGEWGYLSSGITGDMVTLAFDPESITNNDREAMREFFKRYPQYGQISSCVHQNISYKMVRTCVGHFFSGALGPRP